MVNPLRRSGVATDSAGACWSPQTGRINLRDGGPFDAVIHLAGESIAQRWTPAAKARIRSSRVDGTKLLSSALAALDKPPQVLIAASAVGYYGNRGEEIVDEQSPSGTGFLAEVCREWEAATGSAVERAIRVVHLRLGIVLTNRGGALAKMLPPFKSGLGGRLGNGRQYWSWIALEDLLRIIQHVLVSRALSGPLNAVSPNPITNIEFTCTLGKVVRRPTFFPMPAFAVKLLFGQMGEEALLASCRVLPKRLEEEGFGFRFAELEGAFTSALESKQ